MLNRVQEACPGRMVESSHYNLVVLLPGQTLPVHFDIPSFDFIDKNRAPAWLQVALALSKLKEENEIKQIQVVSYLNGNKFDSDQGGELVIWPHGAEGRKRTIHVTSNTGVIMDGVHVAHGVALWNLELSKKRQPLHVDKDDDAYIQYNKQGMHCDQLVEPNRILR